MEQRIKSSLLIDKRKIVQEEGIRTRIKLIKILQHPFQDFQAGTIIF